MEQKRCQILPSFSVGPAVGAVSVPAGDISAFANGSSAPDLRESQESFFVAFQGSCPEKRQHDVSLSQGKREASLKDGYFVPLDLEASLVFQLAA